MANPVNSPIVTTYASHEPYLTPAEYLASPTGVDTSQLVPGGDPNANMDALKQTIARASSAMDSFCRKVLAATVDTQAGLYRIRSDGTVVIKLKNTPILQVLSVAYGTTQSGVVPMTDLSQIGFGEATIIVPIVTLPSLTYPSVGGKLWVTVTYVNGWANSLLTVASSQGANSFTVDNTLGILPGVPLTFYDPGNTEQLTVLSVTSSTTFTTTTGAQKAHALDANGGPAVSALPPYVKQACVLWTSGLIKTRGDDSFVMPALGAQPSQEIAQIGGGTTTGGTDIQKAMADLLPLRRAA